MGKRFVSIDILRGIAIIFMLILHVFYTVLDITTMRLNQFENPIINLLLLMALPVVGGMTGLFLMVSAIGNMVSMTKQLQSGRNAGQVALRQVIGGILLLFFAMLVEGLIGYYGYIGEFVQHIGDFEAVDHSVWKYRWLHQGTLHTIAWCQILNGIIQGIISSKERWKNYRFVRNSYLIAIVLVLSLTGFFWWLVRFMYPGYPYTISTDTGVAVMYVYLGKSSFKDGVLLFIFAPLAGHWEPIFPYLATSFLGSMIGAYIMQDRSKISHKKIRLFFFLGLFMILVGLTGFVINTIEMIKQVGYNATIDPYYVNLWDLTYQTQDNLVPYAGWLFIYLLLTGVALIFVMSFITLVELRGNPQKFAKRTRIIRQFGTFGLTIYTIQGVFFLVHYLLTFNSEPYRLLDWGFTILAVLFTLLALYGILWVWEKLRYIGTLEWCYGAISLLIVPGKIQRKKSERKQYNREKLNFKNILDNEDWIGLDPYLEQPTIENKYAYAKTNIRDSKIALYFSICSLFFFPYAIFSLIVVGSYLKRNHKDWRTWVTLILSIVVIIFIIGIIVLSSLFSLEDLRIDDLLGFGD